MAGRTYHEKVLVVRKTRLRESDLILTMAAEDGRQVRAVAKGALKPTSGFASRLELYAEAAVLLACGRSLDIVKEARLIDAHAPLRFDYERGICAAPLAEMLACATQPDLPVPQLHPMACAALSAMEGCPHGAAPLVLAAFLLKASSILGFRPSLTRCVACGAGRAFGQGAGFTHEGGGVLCAECAPSFPAVWLEGSILDWAQALLRSTFADIVQMQPDAPILKGLVLLCRSWVQVHIAPLKSLHFVLSGL